MFKRALSSLAFCLPLLAALPAMAEEELAPGFDACMEKNESTAGMLGCMAKADKYLDAKLNEAYKKAKAACDSDACRKHLADAERAWIKYRDAMAIAVMDMSGGGSMAQIAASQFKLEETKKQTKWLASEDE